ncbi:alpha-beta hydrolase superfamily lysophospholipase [Mucilaginibacter frigoritolerans]|uniref:Alpha-beta hydrolase superfamily lysophospholipase n=1 Tax=Mucilaginibacter frigoritolerans TaxID=652788 RepID=A0A562TVB0_9SPHI|nr:alpha/beta hydrolase [Mucilaginibacter frigoritolerans]TWI97551.1 alpha-beta hydrolase superfamily lysophospholipase [Mucilaginibacter frigoritolerans]
MKLKLLFLSLSLFFMSHRVFSQAQEPDTKMIKSKTIVFIHGLFVNPESWEAWKAYFEAKGYKCYTPANPYHEGNPADLRKNIDPRLAKVNFEDVVNNIAKLIDSLPEKPILIGHSMAGLVVQKLISMNKGAAGVCIDGAAPVGIITLKWSFWNANLPAINPLKGHSVFIPTQKWFYYAFCNTMTRAESDKVFDEIAVPESRSIPRGTLKSFAKIDLKKPHNPLLIIAGEKDHIVPPSLNLKNFKAYKDTSSVITFKEFKGRSHYIVGEPNWQEVAGYVYNWLNK